MSTRPGRWTDGDALGWQSLRAPEPGHSYTWHGGAERLIGSVVVATVTTLALWGSTTATAEAAYLKSFTVRDTGASIRWSVTVCTAGRGRVRRFSAQLLPESQGVPHTRTFGGGSSGPGCDRWSMSAKDIWSEQVWSSQMTVVMGGGQILRSGYRDFYVE